MFSSTQKYTPKDLTSKSTSVLPQRARVRDGALKEIIQDADILAETITAPTSNICIEKLKNSTERKAGSEATPSNQKEKIIQQSSEPQPKFYFTPESKSPRPPKKIPPGGNEYFLQGFNYKFSQPQKGKQWKTKALDSETRELATDLPARPLSRAELACREGEQRAHQWGVRESANTRRSSAEDLAYWAEFDRRQKNLINSLRSKIFEVESTGQELSAWTYVKALKQGLADAKTEQQRDIQHELLTIYTHPSWIPNARKPGARLIRPILPAS